MDNDGIHKSKKIHIHIEGSNNYLLYSVPYHPETNAIKDFLQSIETLYQKKSKYLQ